MDSRSEDTPKHSPGPFTHNVSTHPAGIIEYDENTISDADGCTLIRQCCGSLGHGVHGDFLALDPGDWHLFAAAPEMLEALKECRLFIGRMPHPDFANGGTVDVIYKNILQVIAKAEGRTP